MQFINEPQYAEWKAKNADPYGGCCFTFAEAWADAMEAKIANGAKIADIAEDTFVEVDSRPGFGITGFMYGIVISILARHWAHGEELRRWHNLDAQSGDEGERANENGTVLNPALLNIG